MTIEKTSSRLAWRAQFSPWWHVLTSARGAEGHRWTRCGVVVEPWSVSDAKPLADVVGRRRICRGCQ